MKLKPQKVALLYIENATNTSVNRKVQPKNATRQ